MRAVLVKTLIAIAVVLVLLSVLGVVFEQELELFAQWIADRLGFTGLCAILLVTDTVVTPFPPDVLLIVIAKSAFAANWPFHVGILGAVSAWAGMQGWAIGRWLGHRPLSRRLFGEFKSEHSDLVKKYGLWAVLGGAVTPVPFSVTCWSAGVLGLGFWPVLAACLFRIPRFYLYYGLIVTGVSVFNGKL